MAIEFYTVVYRIEGDKMQHVKWWQSVQSLFLGRGKISITTIAVGDLIAELDKIEAEQLTNGGSDAA